MFLSLEAKLAKVAGTSLRFPATNFALGVKTHFDSRQRWVSVRFGLFEVNGWVHFEPKTKLKEAAA